MRLPAKIEYAYKAVLELAARYNGENPIQLNVICQSQEIPKKFLIQLLLRLKNANIVDSSRGMAGGYYLTRSPSQISLADIFGAIDDTLVGSPKRATYGRVSEPDRIILRIWDDISKETVKRLEGITFDKLILQIKSEQFTYQI